MSPTSNQQGFRSTTLDASIETESGNRRKQHFRSLVSDIAEHLDASDVDKIIWQKELPQKMKDKPALAVLEWLYSHGDYSISDVRPLAQLLKDIHREDITEKVESYQEKFGESAIFYQYFIRIGRTLLHSLSIKDCNPGLYGLMAIESVSSWLANNDE